MTLRRFLVLALPLALILAACSSAGASTAPSPGATEAPADATGAPSDATVVLADNELGRILVDADGRTLYGFTADVDGASTCYDDCAVNWPPLLGDASATVGDGLDASKLTTTERTDGTTQLVYGDWPLYYWVADAAPGDTTGQGVGGVWFVIGADGSLIGPQTGRDPGEY